jgi:NAD-dependent dihydropyrimidine dehydrogenase PreA subunit
MTEQNLYLKNVVTLQLDHDKCVGCGTCMVVCPHEVFALDNGKVRIDQRDACMECGACAVNCVAEAITVEAGVGCAMAVINSALGRQSSSCCCVVETKQNPATCTAETGAAGKSGCC